MPRYMAAWTAINMDHIREGGEAHSMVELGTAPSTGGGGGQRQYYICKSRWWDYVIELGEYWIISIN